MSLLVYLGELPVFTTIEEAEAWGSNYGITGYHTHIYNGVTGYMSGANHDDLDIIFNDLGITLDTSLTPNMPQPLEGLDLTPTPQVILPEENITLIEEEVEEEIEEQVIIQPVVATPVVPTTPSTPTYSPSGGGSSGGGGGY